MSIFRQLLSYFQLDKGKSWTFLRTEYNPDGSVIQTDTITKKIVKDSSLYGFKWAFESYERCLYQTMQGLWSVLYIYPQFYTDIDLFRMFGECKA